MPCDKNCCCNCLNHFEDWKHCCTEPDRKSGDRCVCSELKGWICMTDGTRAHSGWSEHGICELHLRNKHVYDIEYHI